MIGEDILENPMHPGFELLDIQLPVCTFDARKADFLHEVFGLTGVQTLAPSSSDPRGATAIQPFNEVSFGMHGSISNAAR